MSTKTSVFGALALPRRRAGRDMGYVLDCYGPCSEPCSCSPEPHHTTVLSRFGTNSWSLSRAVEDSVIIRSKQVPTEALLSSNAAMDYYSDIDKAFFFFFACQ